MARKKTEKTIVNDKIEAALNEINTVEDYISNILHEENFTKLDIINTQSVTLDKAKNNTAFQEINSNCENMEFISVDLNSLSPYKELITEKEFYKIVGFVNNKLSSRSGLYQENLFGHYLDAKENQDSGYIYDVLNKAIVFQNNLNYVKSLMKNKLFMAEWRKDFGKISPAVVFKHDGNLRRINIIRERII